MLMTLRTHIFAAVLLVGLQPAFATDPINLNIPEYLPYTSMAGGTAHGIGVERVTQLFASVGLDVKLHGATFNEAVQQIKAGTSDGFFYASRNPERDMIALFIAPITYVTWNWYLPADSKLDPKAPDFPQQTITGVVAGSNQVAWLTQHDFHTKLAQSPTELPKLLLEHGGINSVLGAELVINDAIAKAGYQLGQFKIVELEKKPFGIYIAKTWAAQNPEKLAELKAAVAKLTP